MPVCSDAAKPPLMPSEVLPRTALAGSSLSDRADFDFVVRFFFIPSPSLVMRCPHASVIASALKIATSVPANRTDRTGCSQGLYGERAAASRPALGSKANMVVADRDRAIAGPQRGADGRQEHRARLTPRSVAGRIALLVPGSSESPGQA